MRGQSSCVAILARFAQFTGGPVGILIIRPRGTVPTFEQCRHGARVRAYWAIRAVLGPRCILEPAIRAGFAFTLAELILE